MNFEAQAKLLRVLQERVVRPVGCAEPEPIDCRIIASTNRDPLACANTGSFRRDLYYRLMETSVAIPPLRERREDIPLLIEHVLDELRASEGSRIRGVTAQAQELFKQWPWAGNVRELINVIKSAALSSQGNCIDVADLPRNSGYGRPASEPTAELFGLRLPTLAEWELRLIAEALRRSGGRKSIAADCLGISRPTLSAKMRRYRLTGVQSSGDGDAQGLPGPNRPQPRKRHLRLVDPGGK